jgi:hypothetical protein
MMGVNDTKAEFKTEAAVIKRDGIKDLMEWLELTDFFTAPASTRFHGNFEGGLARHSLNVYSQLENLVDWYGYDKEYSRETLAIVALFHDICKVGYYKTEMRWRKDDKNQWEQYATYRSQEDFAFGGHGSKSMFLVQNFIKLTPYEAVAINCHMGQWDATTYSNPTAAYEQCPLAWLLHVADEAAAFIDKV